MSSCAAGTSVAAGSKRDVIIDIAAESFARRGFHGVSMRDIAKANGSSVATLYNHFTSKDALMLAIGQRFFAVAVHDLEVAATAPGNGLARLLSMVHVTYTDGIAYRNEYLTLSHDKRHVCQTAELQPLVAARRACITLWHQVLDEGMRDGSIRPALDPAATIWIVSSALTGIIDDNRASQFAGSVLQDPLLSLCSLLTDGLRPHS